MDSELTGSGAVRVALDFRRLFESAPGLFAVVLPDSPAFTIVAASDAYLGAANKKREDIIGKSLFEAFRRPDDQALNKTLQNLRASFGRVLATGQADNMPVQRFDPQVPASQGGGYHERYWSPVNAPVLGENGEVQFIIHRVEDVSDFVRFKRFEQEQGPLPSDLRIRADQVEGELLLRTRQFAESQRILQERREVEERLRDSEARFTIAFDGAPVGMLLATPEGRIVEVNQAYRNMLGYSREELESGDPTHYTHPDDIAATREFLESLKRNSGTLAIEKRYIRSDGTVSWARVSARMRRDHAAQPIQLIAIVEDITERKRSEELLGESQERLRAIYDGTYEYIGLLAPDGTLLEANRASLEFAQNRREDVVGRPFWETAWFTSTPGAPEMIRAAVARAAKGEFVRYEATLRRPSGELLTFDMSLHPIRNDHGEVALIVPEGRNVTDRRELQLRDAFLVKLDDATRPLSDPSEITQTAARMLGEYLDVNRAAYADVEKDEDTFNLTGDYNRGVASIIGRYTFTQFGDECLRLMREGKPYVVTDAESDPRVAAVIESYRMTQIRSVICVPLLKAGKFAAAMAVHQITPRRWRQDEVELVQLVASRCWESIERSHVARELQASERRLRLSQRVGRIGSFEWFIKTGEVIWTPELEELYGVPEGAFEGVFEHWAKRILSEDAERIRAEIERCIGSRQSEYVYEFRAILPDGTMKWLRGQAQFFYDADGACDRMVGVNIDIDEQKQAENRLYQQWKTFDTALSHTPDFTYIFDLDGRFTYVNRSLLSLWQKPLEEAVGKNFFELEYPAELAGRLQRQIQQVIDTKVPVRDQTPYTGPTGETRYYDYIFVPVLAADGRVEAVAGSTRDITEQKKADELVQEDRRRWRELMLHTPAAIAILRGPEHRFEWVNGDYLRLTGRPLEEIAGKPIREALPEIARQVYAELLDGVYQTGESVEGHESLVRLQQGNGELQDVYVNFVYLPTRNVAGQIDGIFVHSVDVTDMVVARKQVEDSERQFRTLAETIPHLAWMADETGHIFWYNRRWYEFTGTTYDEMAGWGWQSVHDPAVLPKVLAQWREALATGQPFEMVFPLRGADGVFRMFLTRIEPVRDKHGRVVRWFGTNTDITDQRRTEEKLRRMNRELEEFAYVASHDLQEPLRMVNIYTQLILRLTNAEDPQLIQYAGFVQQGVSRMEALIHDLLTFSRTVHAEETPAGVADLAAALRESLSALKSRIDETGAVIQAGSLPAVRADTPQLAQVFQNILSNALKYRKASVRPEIQITAEPDGKFWTVHVRDNGIGFEQRYAERIFGLFKRLHKDEYPGTGLGLAICKRIIERYGGRMWAEGKPDEGATVSFSLPRLEEQS